MAEDNDDIKEFLVSPVGQIETSGIVPLTSNLVDRIRDKECVEAQILTRISAKRDEIEVLEKKLPTLDQTRAAFQQFRKLELKIKLLKLSCLINALKNCDVTDIPSIVIQARTEFSGKLLKTTRMHQFMTHTIHAIRQVLLPRFHAIFESHLEQGAVVGNQHQISQHADLWRSFIPVARIWLMSYAMVCLLPVVCSESESQVVDQFRSVLDESLTPLWARFHFHLEAARAAQSQQQLMWTFSYAKSFAKLLVDICLQITTFGSLQQLCAIDYDVIILKYVTDKCLGFMRAHIALVLVQRPVLDVSFCVQFFEECADFDSFIHSLHAEQRGSSTLCAVLFSAKAFFRRWLQVEHSFVHRSVMERCEKGSGGSSFVNDEVLFSVGFQYSDHATGSSLELEDRRYFDAENSNSLDQHPQATDSGFKCYSVVYNCSTLLLQVLERYRFFPKEAVSALSETIPEPLLCLCVGLLLYRVRCNAVLREVSSQNFGRGAAILAKDFEVPAEVGVFLESAAYLDMLLSGMAEDSTLRDMPASCARLRERWGDIQEGSAEVAAMGQHTASSVFGSSSGSAGAGGGSGIGGMLRAVIDAALLDNRCLDPSEGIYWKSVDAAAASAARSGGGGHSSAASDTLGQCVHIVCALTNALTGVLRQQLSTRLLNAT